MTRPADSPGRRRGRSWHYGGAPAAQQDRPERTSRAARQVWFRSAEVGISVSTAVDVAKDAADIILLERSLNVLHEGIIEGRKAFGNVMKYLLMGTSSNFGNMFSMAVASLFLPFLPMLPTQILLNNFLYDLAQVTIPTDHVDRTFIHKPQRWNVSMIRDFMIYIGPISSVYDFLTFFALLKVFSASEQLFHTGWFVESLATQTFVIFIIRTAGNPFRSRLSSRPNGNHNRNGYGRHRDPVYFIGKC
jgi:Mg2+-importing ATPase